jgi:hypothetical protein
MVPASERAKTVHALDHLATVTDRQQELMPNKFIFLPEQKAESFSCDGITRFKYNSALCTKERGPVKLNILE